MLNGPAIGGPTVKQDAIDAMFAGPPGPMGQDAIDSLFD
jgi:hypothetical protein